MCVDHTVGFYVWGTQRSKPFAAQEIKLKQVGRVRINCSFRLYTVDQSLKAICMTYTAQIPTKHCPQGNGYFGGSLTKAS